MIYKTMLSITRSQLRRSTRYLKNIWEGQNQSFINYWTRVVREIRSLRGNAKCCFIIAIRPSTQGNWECPKFIFIDDLRQAQRQGVSRNKARVAEAARGLFQFESRFCFF